MNIPIIRSAIVYLCQTRGGAQAIFIYWGRRQYLYVHYQSGISHETKGEGGQYNIYKACRGLYGWGQTI